MPASLAVAGAVLVAIVAAWWGWRGRLASPLAWLGAVGRATAVAGVLLALLDPGIGARLGIARPLVLLDRSLSMHATGGRADSAAVLAVSLGDTVAFGSTAAGAPGTASTLLEPLQGATAAGRPIIVVTDGEIADAGALPTDLRAVTSVQLVPRQRAPDVALVATTMPTRVTAGDTMAVMVDLRAIDGWRDSTTVVVRDGPRELARRRVALDSGAATRVTVPVVIPRDLRGERWLEVAREGPPDGEAADDVRWHLVRVAETPGVVAIVTVPDFDARDIVRTLDDVLEVPVRAYVQLSRGRWQRSDTFEPVTLEAVEAAARNADLLVVRGDTAGWSRLGRARLLWPPADELGDWYVQGSDAAPLAAAFRGVPADSLPSLTGVARAPAAAEWVALEALRDRRGTARGVAVGRETGGRTLLLLGDGFHRWAIGGGLAAATWRTLVGEAAAWLLAAAPSTAAAIRVATPVVQRGEAVTWQVAATPDTMPLVIRLEGPAGTRLDTVRVDGDGRARLFLPVGRYAWSTSGGSGQVGVEPYADELVPAPVTLAAAAATVAPTPPRRSLRDVWPLFALALAGLVIDWMARRQLGLR